MHHLTSPLPQVTEQMRCTLVHWLLKVNRQLHFGQETVFLAVNLADRFLALTPLAQDCLQLLAVSTLFLAAKMVSCVAKIVTCVAKMVSCVAKSVRNCVAKNVSGLVGQECEELCGQDGEKWSCAKILRGCVAKMLSCVTNMVNCVAKMVGVVVWPRM